MLNRFLSILVFVTGSSTYAVGNFVPVYTDSSSKLSWSKAIPGVYTNGCVGENGEFEIRKCTYNTSANGEREVKLDDSDAAKACRYIGARLPNNQEFESLIRQFDHTEKSWGPQLTDKGIADMQYIFKDMSYLFWSSSVDLSYPDTGFVFRGQEGDMGPQTRQYDYNNAVRCVRSSTL